MQRSEHRVLGSAESVLPAIDMEQRGRHPEVSEAGRVNRQKVLEQVCV